MAEEPLAKCVTEIKASDGKLYVSAVFDFFDSGVIGLAMDINMKAPLCVQHWKIQRKCVRASVEQLSTVTGGASIPASFTGMRSINITYSKA